MTRKSVVKKLMDKLIPPLFNGVPIVKEWTCQGLTCRVIHTRMSYCGYVGVPNKHSKAVENVSEENYDVDVHGGITFKEEIDNVIWFGFDCAHAGDEIILGGKVIKGHHWTLDEVVEETNFMARQLKGIVRKYERIS